MAEMTVRVEGSVATAPAPGTTVKTALVPSLPDSSEYLGGTAVTNGAIITIPQGRSWYGKLTVSADYHPAAAGQAVVGVATTGTGAKPDPAGKVLELRLSAGTDLSASDSIETQYFAVYTGSTAATLTLAVPADTDVTAVAYGWLI